MGVKILKGFAAVWGGAVGVALAGFVLRTWWLEGFGAVQDLLSPFNVLYYGAAILLFAPAAGAYALAEKMERGREPA